MDRLAMDAGDAPDERGARAGDPDHRVPGRRGPPDERYPRPGTRSTGVGPCAGLLPPVSRGAGSPTSTAPRPRGSCPSGYRSPPPTSVQGFVPLSPPELRTFVGARASSPPRYRSTLPPSGPWLAPDIRPNASCQGPGGASEKQAPRAQVSFRYPPAGGAGERASEKRAHPRFFP